MSEPRRFWRLVEQSREDCSDFLTWVWQALPMALPLLFILWILAALTTMDSSD